VRAAALDNSAEYEEKEQAIWIFDRASYFV